MEGETQVKVIENLRLQNKDEEILGRRWGHLSLII